MIYGLNKKGFFSGIGLFISSLFVKINSAVQKEFQLVSRRNREWLFSIIKISHDSDGGFCRKGKGKQQ